VQAAQAGSHLSRVGLRVLVRQIGPKRYLEPVLLVDFIREIRCRSDYRGTSSHKVLSYREFQTEPAVVAGRHPGHHRAGRSHRTTLFESPIRTGSATDKSRPEATSTAASSGFTVTILPTRPIAHSGVDRDPHSDYGVEARIGCDGPGTRAVSDGMRWMSGRLRCARCR
jgi:hypothetical protein